MSFTPRPPMEGSEFVPPAGLIEVSCLQTSPGHELSVVRHLARHFNSLRCPYTILKGLGGFDLILLHEAPDFEPLLNMAGEVPGVRKSNTFHCFPPHGVTPSEIIKEVSNCRFTGFSFLKFRPKNNILEASRAAKFLNEQKTAYCLGTIGWYELLAITPRSSIISFYEELVKRLRFHPDDALATGKGVKKAFSVLGINLYPELLGLDEAHGWTLQAVLKVIDQYIEFREEIAPQLRVIIRISCSPEKEQLIKEFWQGLGEFCHVLGKFDFAIQLKEALTWGEVISHLLCFRHEFGEWLSATDTQVTYRELDPL